MTAKVALYIEGGGDARALQQPLKQGFKKLFAKAVSNINDLEVIPCGGRGQAYKDFRTAFESGKYGHAMLLLDSEGPVAPGIRAWQYFASGGRPDDVGFARPNGASDDTAHLMVQMMEAWFITDANAFRIFYGQKLQERSLSNTTDLEQIPKNTIIPSLEAATRQTSKGAFKKKHGSDLIAVLDVDQLRRRSVHADGLFEVLQRHLGAPP